MFTLIERETENKHTMNIHTKIQTNIWTESKTGSQTDLLIDAEAGSLNKSSCLARALGVTKYRRTYGQRARQTVKQIY
jgi:hypothetical protein